MTGGGTVDEPIGRHRSDRLRRPYGATGVRRAPTIACSSAFAVHTYLRVKLDTGRTHQIRVHLAHLKHSLVGDPVYGTRLARPRGAGDALLEALRGFRRQALHAAALAFDHPQSGERLAFEAPPPADFAALLQALRTDAPGNAALRRSIKA